MKVKWPWNGRCQGDDPNKQDDEAGTASGDLKSHRETDGQDSVRPYKTITEKNTLVEFLHRSPV